MDEIIEKSQAGSCVNLGNLVICIGVGIVSIGCCIRVYGKISGG